jgi:2-polyprenyl-3-methyl-5-hydroxy-6-metoxy-1,4-benzoquinol methylase
MIERTVGGLHAHLYSLLENVVGQTQGTSILDIGCGTGAWLNRMKSMGFDRLVGIDYVKPVPVAGLDLRRFDINHDLSETLGQFDVVSCIEVIEHIENIGNLLDLVKSTLSKEGFAFLTTPNIESLRARLRALVTGRIPSFDDKSDLTHLCPILQDSLKKMLHGRGLSITEVHQYPAAKSKSLMFGRSVNTLANALRTFLPDDKYGDNAIYVVRHTREGTSV